jgi:hypothetical protein
MMYHGWIIGGLTAGQKQTRDKQKQPKFLSTAEG